MSELELAMQSVKPCHIVRGVKGKYTHRLYAMDQVIIISRLMSELLLNVCNLKAMDKVMRISRLTAKL